MAERRIIALYQRTALRKVWTIQPVIERGDVMTTLTVLCNVICRELSLVKNQTVLFQLAVRFTCTEIYNSPGVRADDLVSQIKRYLKCRYEREDTKPFESLHKEFYKNLTQCSHLYGSMELKAEAFGEISPNVNKIIRGKRGIPQYWVKEYRESNGNIERMAERLYWFLQYLSVYYGNYMIRNEQITKDATDLTDYYILNDEKAEKANRTIKQYLQVVFRYKPKYCNYKVDLWTIAVVIVLSIVKQYNENGKCADSDINYAKEILRMIKKEEYEYLFQRECNKANAFMQAYFAHNGEISFQDVIRQYQQVLKVGML